MTLEDKNNLDSFRRISWITVIAVYLLIFIGGVVRSTGSGMGCPDWPKCFGSVIPPTDVRQLPDNYQEIYLNKRIAKNERFVATLEALGFSKLAHEIANDKSILIEESFNPVKTWIEYLNRLAGVAIGIFIILTVWRSLPLWKVDKTITLLSFFNLFLVIFIGWIGSIVVSTNLLHWMITFHMVQAILLAALLIYVNHRASRSINPNLISSEFPSKVKSLLIVGTALMFLQVVLGTQVREQIDIISSSLGDLLREEWIARLGIEFLIHRSFSLVLLLVHILFFYWMYKYSYRKSKLNRWTLALMILILLEIATGISMAYFGIPAFLQPFHLVIGTLIIGVQVILILQIGDQKQSRINSTIS